MVNEQDNDIVQSEFELQLHYYVRLQTISSRKEMNLFNPTLIIG